MADTKKYLDLGGVETLWNAVKAADTAVVSNINDSKGSHINWNATTKKIELWATSDMSAETGKLLSSFDASDFIVDGMLNDVEVVDATPDAPILDKTSGTFLKFTWKDADGKDGADKITYIEASKIGKIYTGSDSITIDSETNAIEVSNVQATKTTTTKTIPVAGGPLESLLKGAGITEIVEGTSMEDVLFKLICKELWPVKSGGASNVSTSDATLVSTMSTPSLTYNGKNAHNQSSTVEVGASVSYSASTAASSYTATPHKASGLTYGYSTANDDIKDSPDTTKSAAFGTISPVADSIPTLILSGKVTETLNGTAGSKDAAAASKSGNVVITEGDNKITAKGTSITFTGTCSKLDVVYGCSNLGNTNNDGTTYPSTEKAAVTLTSAAVTSGAITINCVGAYKYFYGYPSAVPASKSDIVALANKGFLSGTTLSINTAGTVPLGKYMVVAVPKGWEYSSFVNGMNLDDVSAFYTDTNEVDYTLDNGDVVTYNVHWCGPFGADTNYNSFKLTKK